MSTQAPFFALISPVAALPGGGGGPGGGPAQPNYPSHPIFYPPGTSPGYPWWAPGGGKPHPEFPIAWPPGMPGGPGGGPEPPVVPPFPPPGPSNPIAGQPTPTPPSQLPGWVLVYVPDKGWQWFNLAALLPPATTTPPTEPAPVPPAA